VKKSKVYAMISTRAGSTRLKMKNLALINDKPMISYAINTAKDSGIFDKIIVNSENDNFAFIWLNINGVIIIEMITLECKRNSL